jgi:hypothetical protein
MPGARCARSLVCESGVLECTRVFTASSPESPGIPRAMVYGLYRALPGDRLVDTVIGGNSANLTPAPRRQDHTTSPSASAPFVRKRISVHRIPPRVRDVAQRPSVGQDGASCKFDLPDADSEIFLQKGMDTPQLEGELICPSGSRTSYRLTLTLARRRPA